METAPSHVPNHSRPVSDGLSIRTGASFRIVMVLRQGTEPSWRPGAIALNQHADLSVNTGSSGSRRYLPRPVVPWGVGGASLTHLNSIREDTIVSARGRATLPYSAPLRGKPTGVDTLRNRGRGAG